MSSSCVLAVRFKMVCLTLVKALRRWCLFALMPVMIGVPTECEWGFSRSCSGGGVMGVGVVVGGRGGRRHFSVCTKGRRSRSTMSEEAVPAVIK